MGAHDALLYHGFASVYDVVFERFFERRIRRAIRLIKPRVGQRLLDVGVGTGLSLPLYPKGLTVVGVDLAGQMLAQARKRGRRHGIETRLAQMDAQRMGFPDGCFDLAVVAYIASVVPDPRALMREVARVVRPSGVIAVLNHFRAASGPMTFIEDRLAPLCLKLGWRSDQRMEDVFDVEEVTVTRVTTCSRPDLWKIVLCRSKGPSGATEELAGGKRS